MKDETGMDNCELSRVAKALERLEEAAKGVMIAEESFRVLAGYVQSIRAVLLDVSDPVALGRLEQEVARAQHLAKRCSSAKTSKFYLVLKCEEVLSDVEDVTRSIGRCLDALGAESLGAEMREATFPGAPAAVVAEVSEGIRSRETNSEYANELLLQLARAAGVATDVASLKFELESLKREKEEARKRENQEEFRHLEQIIALLSRADAATSASEKDVNYQKKRGSGGLNPLPPLQSFYCPITHEIMEEPVEIASGQTYERAAIEKWFSAGNSNCPTTKVELENLQIKLNLALRQSIQEWKERNIAISIGATKPKLESGEEVEICSALRTLLSLSEEKGIHRYWISLEGLIPTLVLLLSSHQRTVRKETLEVLRSLSVDNKENKEQIAAAGAIKLVVKSLARDVGEGRQAVALLRELSKDAGTCEKIGKVQGCILLLVTMLNAENHHAVTDARELLFELAHNDQNVVQMGEANYFGPLTKRLNDGPDMTKILMASALSRMGLTDQSKAALAAQGAIPPLVRMISVGKLEAKAAALGALKNLSTLPENRELMIESGVIPPLLQLLFSVTSVMMSLKENAAATLANLAMACGPSKIDHHGDILECDETMFQLLSLLNLAGHAIQGHLLRALLGMSSIPNAREVRIKMREGGAIQLLLPFCESQYDDVRIHALKLLKCLSSEGAGKDLADHLGLAYIKALVKLLVDSSTDEEKMAVVGIISNLPASSTHISDILLQADALSAVVKLLVPQQRSAKSGTRAVRNALQESAAGALLRFTSPENPNYLVLQQKTADLDAIPLLVSLLQTGTPLAKRRAAMALGHFSTSSERLSSWDRAPQSCFMWCSRSTAANGCAVHGGPCTVRTTFCLVMANAVGPLVQALEEQEDGADDAALDVLSTLLDNDATLENGVKVIAQAQGIRPIVRLLTVGSVGAKERAVCMLEKIFRIEEYKVEFGSTAQMPLIDLTQKGSIATRPTAAKILAHLNILHNQSTYF